MSKSEKCNCDGCKREKRRRAGYNVGGYQPCANESSVVASPPSKR